MDLLAPVYDVALVGQGANGLEAVELYEQYRPDILLMDIMMPFLDGISATQRLLEAHPQARRPCPVKPTR
jgi:YesN/AraC family two-component response regulator